MPGSLGTWLWQLHAIRTVTARRRKEVWLYWSWRNFSLLFFKQAVSIKSTQERKSLGWVARENHRQSQKLSLHSSDAESWELLVYFNCLEGSSPLSQDSHLEAPCLHSQTSCTLLPSHRRHTQEQHLEAHLSHPCTACDQGEQSVRVDGSTSTWATWT